MTPKRGERGADGNDAREGTTVRKGGDDDDTSEVEEEQGQRRGNVL